MRASVIAVSILAFASTLAAQFAPAPTVTVTSSANPSVYGSPVTFSITVKGSSGFATPSGAVTIIDSAANQSPLAVLTLDSNGTAQISFPYTGSGQTVPYLLSAGTHTIGAVYPGDKIYPTAYTTGVTQQVYRAATQVALSPTQTTYGVTNLQAIVVVTGGAVPCPSVTGQPQHDGSPTGTVEFFNGGQSLGAFAITQGALPNCGASTFISLSTVSNSITATYSGDANYTASTASNLPGNNGAGLGSTTSLTASPLTPNILQSIAFTATIGVGDGNPPPTGSVQFFLDGVSLLGTSPVVNFQASITSPPLSGGGHNISANYTGDNNYQPSTDSAGLYVSKLPAAISLTAAPTSSVYGQPVTLTAKLATQAAAGVSGPSGAVLFATGCYCGIFNGFVTQTVLGSVPVVNGVATLTVSNIPGGSQFLTATYPGDNYWVSVTASAVPISVSLASTAATIVSLGRDAQSGKLAVTVLLQSSGAGTPTGTIQILDAVSGTVLGSASAAAPSTIVALTTAADAVLASYSGDTNFSPAKSGIVHFLAVADAAGFNAAVQAPGEIASIFGSGLAGATSTGSPVQIIDSTGAARTPALLLVSDKQINLVIPESTAIGSATVSVTSGAGPAMTRQITLAKVAPGLFSAQGTGAGLAAAQILRVHSDGTQSLEAVTAAPIAFGSDSLYLILYGTGIHNRSDNANVSASIGSLTLPVLYSGGQGGYAGLDQVNVALPATLRGAGTVNLSVTADGKTSNTVTLTFQ